ncbi:MAG: hypothetical protein H0X45_08875 [Planctomycetes bacterium]|nr:hypothetical protein [Planctomycetota bacterium]
MESRLPVLRCLLVAGIATSIAAVELRIEDIRLSYAYLPDSASDVQGDSERFAADGSLTSSGTLYMVGLDQPRQRVSLGWFHALRAMEAGRGSLVLGFEAIYDLRDDSRRLEQEALIADAFVGWAWPLSPNWHIEQGFVIGGGVQRNTFALRPTEAGPGPVFSGEDETFVLEYGIRIGARWTHDSGFQAGIDISYLVQHSEVDASLTTSDGERLEYQPEIRQEGFAFAAVAGYRL